MNLRFFVIIIILLSQHNNALASAWNLTKNKHQIIAETNYKFFKLKSDDNSYIFNENEFVTTYNHEYGVSDKLTAGINFFYQSDKFIFKSDILIDKIYEITYRKNDIKFYLRRQLYKSNNFVFSVQPLVNRNIAEIRALLGHSYKAKEQDRFFNIEIAYRDIRRNSNELVLDFAFGSYLPHNLTLINQLMVKYNTDRHLRDKFFTHPTGAYNSDQDITIENMLSYRATMQQKISLIKNINDKYSISLGFSNYISDKGFLGNGISLGLWINL